MSAMDELVERLREGGFPFPEEAALVATGGIEDRAAAVLVEIDSPRWDAWHEPGSAS